jgi:murein DD-endopeptidase MepM/ murein hydrolase activator NlpD
MSKLGGVLLVLTVAAGCAHESPYERGDFAASPRLRRSALPLASGTRFRVRQGAFGTSSHRETGNEFSWDLELPWGTPVLAVDGGVVLGLYRPEGGGGCDARFANAAWNLQIEHADGTVAQYVHVDGGSLQAGSRVRRGQVIGFTVERGWLGEGASYVAP